MSRVALKTVLYYEAAEDGCSPLESCIYVEGIEKSFPDIPFPTKGKTYLYGHRNPALLHLLKKTPKNKSSEILTIEAEIGEWFRQKADMEAGSEFSVAKTGFLSLARAKRDIISLCEQLMCEQKGVDFASEDGWPRKGTRYPRVLDAVIDHPSFSHLAVVSYSVHDKVVGDFQVATVFDEKSYADADAGARFEGVKFIF